MRVLVVSDIHGNWPALEAVAAVPHDSVVCLGTSSGTARSRESACALLRANGAEIVQGNHDRALACRPTLTCGERQWRGSTPTSCSSDTPICPLSCTSKAFTC